MQKRQYPTASPAKSDDSWDDPVPSPVSKRRPNQEERLEPHTEVQNNSELDTPRKAAVTTTKNCADLSPWTPSPTKQINAKRRSPAVKLTEDVAWKIEPLTEVQNNSELDTPRKAAVTTTKNCADLSPWTPSPTKQIIVKRRSPAVKLTEDVARNLFPTAENTLGTDDGFPSLRSNKKEFMLKIKSIDRSVGLDLHCIDAAGILRTVFLYGQWHTSLVQEDADISVIDPEIWDSKHLIVSDDRGLLIVLPDTLVPCTSVASSTWCARKILLRERYGQHHGANKSMMIGNVIHELFQIALEAPDISVIDHQWLLEKWKECISHDVMKELCALTFTPDAFQVELEPYAEVIISWIRQHIPHAKFFHQNPLPTKSKCESVYDIEENIWDPLLGLKGKIDVTFKTVMENNTSSMESLELKTGKSGLSLEHHTQVLLYCMMLSSRYDQPITSGSLLYLKDGVDRSVTPKPLELKGVMQNRNRIAYYMSSEDRKIIPEPRSDPHFCGKCEQSLVCSIFQKRVDDAQNTPSTELFREFANSQLVHLEPSHLDYFVKWSTWIFREWSRDSRSKKRILSDIWRLPADEREARGSCASHMKIDAIDNVACSTAWMITFKRQDPIRQGVFLPGTMCTVNSSTKYALLLSFVVKSDAYSITFRCDRVPGLLKKNMEADYHIDLYDSYSIHASVLGNVTRLLEKEECSQRLRKWVIDLEPPVEVRSDSKNRKDLISQLPKSIDFAGMNEEQLSALTGALRCPDYFLIEGLPGTGKSTVIVYLIRSLIAMGKSVLITSFTNSAVDNILIKLNKWVDTKDILRLGKGSIHPDAQKFSLESRLTCTKGDIDQYKETRSILAKSPIVACTCHHVSKEVLFSWRKFDMCIVDEATMVLEPVNLAPLMVASRFVLVGDPRQLSPLVQDVTARTEGMNISLFKRLSIHGHAMICLDKQYRMNREICKVSSSLFYEGVLRCGNGSIAESLLASRCNNPGSVTYAHKDTQVEDPQNKSLIFFDTTSPDCDENQMIRQGNGVVYNPGEASVVEKLTEDLLKFGIDANDIGVMCLYRSQVDMIRKKLKNKVIEVNTVDQYQGRDKKVIIWSLVWTISANQQKCSLLDDPGRINVALTRAKHCLFLIGCQHSMVQVPIMKQVLPFFKIIDSFSFTPSDSVVENVTSSL